eukprot:TRINITY_DN70184_c0_g1_i1.p2 TRINITY_DN70184_c0_g1~~TRINITY_DN70184_c0_g1_i1.p2  ORF type:complete len:156 (+),score=78.05 TRINITY_DN70184_c0_g1_i1:54-521(+)
MRTSTLIVVAALLCLLAISCAQGASVRQRLGAHLKTKYVDLRMDLHKHPAGDMFDNPKEVPGREIDWVNDEVDQLAKSVVKPMMEVDVKWKCKKAKGCNGKEPLTGDAAPHPADFDPTDLSDKERHDEQQFKDAAGKGMNQGLDTFAIMQSGDGN